MKMKIQLSENHYVLVSDKPIKEGDFRLEKRGFLDGTVKTKKHFEDAEWVIQETEKEDLPYVERARNGKNAKSGFCGCYKIEFSSLPLLKKEPLMKNQSKQKEALTRWEKQGL